MLGNHWLRALALLLALARAALAELPESEDSRKIDPSVIRQMARDGGAPVVVLLRDQCDLSAAQSIADEAARGWYVYNELRRQARRSQRALRRTLRQKHIRARSFWVANALTLRASSELIAELAGRADVGRIESDAPLAGIDDPITAEFSAASTNATVEWGISNIRAPQVWALGFKGQGIVVADQDTGFQWNHPAVLSQYRGWNGTMADHNYNWHDSIHSGGGTCGSNAGAPCDDNGHGTHTLGTTIGDDAVNNQIGVAPQARWIGCRNMDRGTGTPTTYMECFQFFLAPTDQNGLNPDAALRPHVMNNSWGCPPSEGCAANTLKAAVEAAEASGIFVEVSAGNSGSNCSTVNDPPALYASSFSVGAYDISNVLAAFSSRGPVLVDGSGRRKPDISAPGVNVRSAWPNNTYANLSGTSMAGPHVTGAVALLWEARPQLRRDIVATKTVLQSSADPTLGVNPPQTCGGVTSGTIPNNSFGYGRLDILAAVNSVPASTPTATATRTQTSTASATASPTQSETPNSTATVTATASVTATPTPTPSVRSALSGTIRYFGGAGQAVSGALVTLQGPTPQTTTSNTTGAYSFDSIGFGDWSTVPSKLGDIGGAITSIDAVYALQIAAGLRVPTTFERLAADASGDGNVSAIDASLILQYRVGLITALPLATRCGSDWLFLGTPVGGGQGAVPQISPNQCVMGAINYPSLATGATQQDFTAVVIGDVSGNWIPPQGSAARAAAAVAQWSRPIPTARGVTRELRLQQTANAIEAEFFLDREAIPALRIRRAPGTHALLAYAVDSQTGRVRVALASTTPLQAGTVVAVARLTPR